MQVKLTSVGKTAGAVMAAVLAGLLLASSAPVQAVNPDAPPSLKTVPVPVVGQFKRFVKNESAAVTLGKTLFWDMQLGSDGVQACASCHFTAGVDNRVKNTLSPGSPSLGFTPFGFGGPNSTITISDFPFPKDRDEVVSSQGVFLTQFNDIILGSDVDNGTLLFDDVFNVGGIMTRRVEPRNAPTMINSIFNHRNFWDGRASSIFNGNDVFGSGTGARVFRVFNKGKVQTIPVNVAMTSLGSQAVGPPLSGFEMSFGGRSFLKVGKKMLSLPPLAKQLVHPEDSVLGLLSSHPSPGINATYVDMIKAAIQNEWWDSNMIVTFKPNGDPEIKKAPNRPLTTDEYTIMEANFALISGLALRFYQSTLVADDTPFDRFQEGDSTALSMLEQDGLDVFLNKGKCINCHGGAEFTNASVSNAGNELIERMEMGDGEIAVYDNGFYNIGVRFTEEDIGVGGVDPFGRPLSFSRQAQLTGENFGFIVDPDERVAVDGAFKTPTVRNVELTGPFFHTGGHATLEHVVEFYDRGGDFRQENIDNLDPDIQPLGLTAYEEEALVAFMKALTDPRVKYEMAPFDRPQLFIPNGHPGDHISVTDDGTGKATDFLLELPAVGRNGRGIGNPLKPFLE